MRSIPLRQSRHPLALVRGRGFTLIEVMVIMVVLGILAAIAIPNYTEYVKRGNRSAAQAYLVNLASRQAQFYLDQRIYADTVAALNVTAPAEINNRYTIAIATNAGPPATYTITATPTGNQTGDRCGVLAIDQSGNRGTAIAGPPVTVGASPVNCW